VQEHNDKEDLPMTLLSPIWLLTLIPVAALAVAYLVVQRRRHRYAVRFATLPMLDRVVPRRPAWRRHLPATVVLIALALLGLAAARPEVALRVPYDRATVMVAIDTSASMAATDVPPSRMEAAKAAASAFVEQLPDTVNVGVVAFSGTSAVVVPPTTEHDEAQAEIEALTLGRGGTAIGEAVLSSVEQVQRMTAEADGEPVPTRVVLLSDGDNTAGRSPDQAAAAAVEAGLPVSTIAYGTPNGTLPGGSGQPVPVDQEALRALAETTGGTSYTAESGEELRSVYADIGSSIGWRTEPREITPYLAALGLLGACGAGAMSLRWFSRLI
jgi:Ca-activated chloride channel homolog